MTNFQDKANFIWQVAKLDLFKKLSQPQISKMLKSEWYSEYR